MPTPIMKHWIGGSWIVVEGHEGFGPTGVFVSVRKNVPDGRRPGARVSFAQNVGRAQILGLAFDLLDVADAMLPETALDTSAVVGTARKQPVPCNRRFVDGMRALDSASRRHREESVMVALSRLERRMPVLQRAQRVLERCDEDTAHWLEDVLTLVERTGEPPVLGRDIPRVPGGSGAGPYGSPAPLDTRGAWFRLTAKVAGLLGQKPAKGTEAAPAEIPF